MAAVTLPGLDRVAARALARVERPAGPRAAVRRAVFPIDAANALGGSDNHWSYSNSVYGTDKVPAGAMDLL